MPAGNGTGPMGLGPMTGRGMGYCAGVLTPGVGGGFPGRGFGMGRGRGWRNRFFATGLSGRQRAAAGWAMAGDMPPFAAPTREQQVEALKGQAEYFEGALGDLRKRLAELDTGKAEK